MKGFTQLAWTTLEVIVDVVPTKIVWANPQLDRSGDLIKALEGGWRVLHDSVPDKEI